MLLYLLAKQAFGSTMPAALASGLLAIDYPHVIQSRLATLEIFVAFFAVAAFYCCLLDRAQILRRVEGLPSHRYGALRRDSQVVRPLHPSSRVSRSSSVSLRS